MSGTIARRFVPLAVVVFAVIGVKTCSRCRSRSSGVAAGQLGSSCMTAPLDETP
jgi:hypothetical protein